MQPLCSNSVSVTRGICFGSTKHEGFVRLTETSAYWLKSCQRHFLGNCQWLPLLSIKRVYCSSGSDEVSKLHDWEFKYTVRKVRGLEENGLNVASLWILGERYKKSRVIRSSLVGNGRLWKRYADVCWDANSCCWAAAAELTTVSVLSVINHLIRDWP